MDNINNIYYNVIINSEDNRGLASFEENRTEPILNNCEDYYMIIYRFYCPMSRIPILIADIMENQPDPNKMIYSVGIEYNGNYNQTFVTYVPSYKYLPVPLGPSFNPGGKQAKSNYYFITTIQALLDMINTTLQTAFSSIPTPPGSTAPFIYYDNSTNFFNLVADSSYYADTLANPISIYMNMDLYPLFDSLPADLLSETAINGKNFRIRVLFNGNNYFSPGGIAPSATTTLWRITQDYNSLSNWNSLLNIVFLSNTIPVRSEQIPAFKRDGESTARNILTDFQPIFDKNGIDRDAGQYFANGIYRLVDLVSTDPLRKFDLSVFWQDKNQILYPLIIAPNETLTMKIYFIKKKLISKLDKKDVLEILQQMI